MLESAIANYAAAGASAFDIDYDARMQLLARFRASGARAGISFLTFDGIS